MEWIILYAKIKLVEKFLGIALFILGIIINIIISIKSKY